MTTKTTSPAQPTKRPARKRKTTRASFGSVRRLPSGRYQARYSDDRMNRHTAPHTFETKTAAEEWLATIRADVVRGTWRAPELGKVTVADYAADHLATRLDLSPRTQRLYADLLTGWIDRPLALRTVPGRPGRGRSVHLGQLPLNAVSVEAVREWYAAALHTAAENAQRRAESRRHSQIAAATHSARSWAVANHYDVKATGRLPRAVLTAWAAAGSPAARVAADLAATTPTVAADAGRAQVAQAYRFLRMVMAHATREGRLEALMRLCDEGRWLDLAKRGDRTRANLYRVAPSLRVTPTVITQQTVAPKIGPDMTGSSLTFHLDEDDHAAVLALLAQRQLDKSRPDTGTGNVVDLDRAALQRRRC